ncbi:unnamed protein product [Prorocentrum cordatum]|uniref:Uncharacterized protein n=1 Tax=Prorocentrum cordatum TaxID=2364126 RepID=A0ABN9RD81_9DINO|nr:unnamed protein product [Polarella glacialis]
MGADACADREAASAGRANSAGGPTDRFIMVWVGGTSKKDGAEAASGLEPKARRGKQRIASMTMRTRAASTERKTERATPSPSPRRPAARDREPGAARHAPRRGARQSPAPILRV